MNRAKSHETTLLLWKLRCNLAIVRLEIDPWSSKLRKMVDSNILSTLIWHLWLSKRNSENCDGYCWESSLTFDVTSKKFAELGITRSGIATTFPKSKIPQRTTCLESIWGDCGGFDEGLITRRYEHFRYSAGTRQMRSATCLKSHRGGPLHHSIAEWS